MAEPSLDSIKDATEKASASVEWLAEIWHSRNWVKKLLLIDALVFAVFNPASFPFILKFFTTAPLPENYPLYFWPVVVLIFIAALIIAIRLKSKKVPAVFDPGERSAIKGLRSFGFDDAEIFRRLQREDMLAECLNAITDRDFRLGILFGESGCGKTSFLQAGIWPMLPQHSGSHQGVYVKFTDLDPFDSIRQAFKEQIHFSAEVALKIGDNLKASAFIELAHQCAEKIEYPYNKIGVLMSIAKSAVTILHSSKSYLFLKQAYQVL